ncbi:MAG: glycosyltransferase family 4 protein [Chloroflexi bacterium]|nr:glycosyltransferase family 4 protein [Chloroflexota bacterium]
MSKKSKNAGMLAYDFYPSEGGIQTFMRSIVAADLDIKWTVLTRKVDSHRLDAEHPYNVARTTLRPQLRIVDRLWLKMRRGEFSLPQLIAFQTEKKLIRLSKHTRADFLFADQLISAASVRVAARRLGIPWGLGVYGKELLNGNEEDRNLLADADLVLACSNYSNELAKSRGANEARTKTLHPSVDVDFFRLPKDRQAARKKLGVDGQETLITVAHLVQRKGHDLVIQALPTIRSIYPNVIYLIVGRGAYENSLRGLAKALGVSESVRFCGYVPTQNLPLYYGAADVHIMASAADGDVEGFGISFIEAAACGTPSIGSRSGGILDAIADGSSGFLVELGDVQGLSKLIMKILENKNLRDQVGLVARKMAETRFSKNAFEQALIDSLNQTIFSERH